MNVREAMELLSHCNPELPLEAVDINGKAWLVESIIFCGAGVQLTEYHHDFSDPYYADDEAEGAK